MNHDAHSGEQLNVKDGDGSGHDPNMHKMEADADTKARQAGYLKRVCIILFGWPRRLVKMLMSLAKAD